MAKDLAPKSNLEVVTAKVEEFISSRRDFIEAYKLDLNSERINTEDIWNTVKKARAMSNTVSKYLADTDTLLRHVESRKELAVENLEDEVLMWIAKQPEDQLKRYAKEERRRVALIACKEAREEARRWTNLFKDVQSFRKSLVQAMENIRGARKDVLASIGAAKLDHSWEPGALGKPVNLIGEALEPEERL